MQYNSDSLYTPLHLKPKHKISVLTGGVDVRSLNITMFIRDVNPFSLQTHPINKVLGFHVYMYEYFSFDVTA